MVDGLAVGYVINCEMRKEERKVSKPEAGHFAKAGVKPTKFVKVISIFLYQLYKSNKNPAAAGSLQEKKYMRKCKTITPAYCVINLWVYYNLINVKKLSKNRGNFMKIVKITCFTQSKLSFYA